MLVGRLDPADTLNCFNQAQDAIARRKPSAQFSAGSAEYYQVGRVLLIVNGIDDPRLTNFVVTGGLRTLRTWMTDQESFRARTVFIETDGQVIGNLITETNGDQGIQDITPKNSSTVASNTTVFLPSTEFASS